MAGGRKKWLKIMSVQHVDGRRKDKMVENHVSPTSGWQVGRLSLVNIASLVNIGQPGKYRVKLATKFG